MDLKTYCPMGRAGRPGELGGAVIYFASPIPPAIPRSC